MKVLSLIYCLLVSSLSWSQTKLPIIKANTKRVAIKDGDYLDKNAWSLAPEARPDIYTASRTRESKIVVFYTDLDSIKTKVKPGSSFDFIILLNGKDSCFTRIVSAIPKENKIKNIKKTNDTIPFLLTKHNAIYIKALLNDKDSLDLHFDISSFDVHLTKETLRNKTTLLSHQANKDKPNYNDLQAVRCMQMGSFRIENPTVLATGFTAKEMDGRIGWNLFEGQSIELDYDNMRLIVYAQSPKHLKGYSKTKIKFLQSFPCIESTLKVGNQSFKGLFLMDTGSEQAMILDSNWMNRIGFPQDLKLLKTTVFRDPRGVKYESKTVLCPSLSLGQTTLQNIPTSLLDTKNPVDFEVNYFGNDVLKRFNLILDFKKDVIYFKPNSLMKTPFKEAS